MSRHADLIDRVIDGLGWLLIALCIIPVWLS
jgi:hypothetical protein